MGPTIVRAMTSRETGQAGGIEPNQRVLTGLSERYRENYWFRVIFVTSVSVVVLIGFQVARLVKV